MEGITKIMETSDTSMENEPQENQNPTDETSLNESSDAENIQVGSGVKMDKTSSEDNLPPKRKIAILGLKGSGKSTFLTVLNRALAQNNSTWKILPLGNTIREMNELTTRLSMGLYPDSTPEGEDPPPMHFHVEQEKRLFGLREGDWFELQAADVPGAAVKGIIGGPQFQHFYKTYVKNCAAIVFLIDPREEWLQGTEKEDFIDYYWPVFNSILAELGEQNTQKMYAAFCITKLDDDKDTPKSFQDEGYWDDFELDLEEKASIIMGSGTKALIDQFFDSDRLRWFPISATGYYIDEKGNRVTQFRMRGNEAGIARPVSLNPLGVAEAIEWVFNSIAKDNISQRDNDRYNKFGKLINRLRL